MQGRVVAGGSAEPLHVVHVAEGPDRAHLAARLVDAADRRQADAVEGGGLDHGVVGHVGEHQAVADLERRIEGVVADHVAGEAGHAPQAVGVGLLVRLAATDDLRAVGHLQHVGHVRRGGGVEDGDGAVILDDIQYGADQVAGVQRDRLARLQVDGEVRMALPEVPDHPHQPLDVVVVTGDMVPAAEVDPLQAGEVVAEALLEGRQGRLQVVAVLLAEGVEVQPLEPLHDLRGEVGRPCAEPGARRAGVIERHRTGGVLRIDPHAAGDPARRRRDGLAEAPPLARGVEAQVVGVAQHHRHLLLGEGRRVAVHLAAEGLRPQARLVLAAGRGAHQVLANQREGIPHGEALQGQQDARAAALLNLAEPLQVAAQQGIVHHIGRGGAGLDVKAQALLACVRHGSGQGVVVGVELDHLPGQAHLADARHEGVGVELLDVKHAVTLPDAFQHQHGAGHRRHAGGVGDRLGLDLLVALLVVADVVDVHLATLTVLDAVGDDADVGLALGARAQRGRVRQHRLQELQRGDLGAVHRDWLDAGHTNVLEHLEVGDVLVGEGHPEADALQALDVLAEGLELLVVEEVDVLLADAVEVELALHRQRVGLLPLALLPVATLRGDLANVDLRVEVGGEGVAVVAAVGIQDVDAVDLVEQVLLGVGAVDVGHARVEAAAQGGHVAGLLVAVLEGPLLLVLELRLVGVLVVGGVEVGHAGLQARLHDGQVLIGQGHVDQHVGLERLDQLDQLIDAVGVHPGGLDRAIQLSGDRLALRLVAAGQQDLAEDLGMLGALVGHDAADAAGADNQDFAHGGSNPDREMSTVVGSYR